MVAAPSSWPRRDAICLDCRTLTDGRRCPAGHTRIRELTDVTGRDALISEVWGSKSLRRRALEAGEVGAVGGTAITTTNGCSVWAGIDDDLGLWLLVAVLAVAVLWFAIGLVRSLIVRRRHRLLANGARRTGLTLGFARAEPGKIVAGSSVRVPFGDRRGVAYALTLRHGRQTMLYDAATVGFEIDLDNGDRVRIPAGACAIDLAKAPRTDLGPYLVVRDPLRDAGEPFDPFVHDRAHGIVLVPGDRVEVIGALIRVADGAGGGGYRDLAHTILVPDGVPVLRRIASPT